MIKIPFSNLPNTTTPVNDTNLNDLQDNVENAIKYGYKGSEQFYSTLDDFKADLITSTYPIGSYIINANINGTIYTVVVDKASNSYLSFIQYGCSVSLKQYKYNNETWKEQLYEIDSGSNANGSWIKYPDGTMICYIEKAITASYHANQTWGNMWESDIIDLGSFPQTFYATPKSIQITNKSGSGGFIESLQGSSTTAIGSIYMCRPLSTNTGFNYTLSIEAIGRWKA